VSRPDRIYDFHEGSTEPLAAASSIS